VVPTYPLAKLSCAHCLDATVEECEIVSPFDPQYKFCSEQCLGEAFATYHCFESRLDMKKIFSDVDGNFESPTSRFLLNLRLVLQKSLSRHGEDSLTFNESDCDHKYGSDKDIGEIEGSEALDNMLTHMGDSSLDQQIGFVIHSLVILTMLESINFIDADTDRDLHNKIGYQLYHNQGVIMMNSHYIYSTTVSKTCKARNDQFVQGSSLYPVLPLLNHSCKANTLR
jgi:hypothetical protein